MEQSQYERLASYLNGRGVPNIDHALKELMLAPVLHPLQNLTSPDNLKALLIQIMQPSKKLDPEMMNIHTEQYRHLILSIEHFTHSQTDTEHIVREAQRGLEVILKLPVSKTVTPSPAQPATKPC